jgi:hypothetical protein
MSIAVEKKRILTANNLSERILWANAHNGKAARVRSLLGGNS